MYVYITKANNEYMYRKRIEEKRKKKEPEMSKHTELRFGW